MYHCTEEERIHAANKHLLIFGAKKSGAEGVDGWVGGLMDWWMDGIAGLRIVHSNQQISVWVEAGEGGFILPAMYFSYRF